MARATVTFDIETIPEQRKLSGYQQELFDKRFASEMKYTGTNPDDTEAVSKLGSKIKGTNPILGNIVCIGLYFDEKDKQVALTGTEPEILTEFWELIKYDSSFNSFNGYEFDIPWVLLRSAKHKINPPVYGNGKSHPFLSRPRFRTWPHFDVAKWVSDWDYKKSLSLKAVCEMWGIASPKEGEIRADGVEEAYLDGKINLIAEYCLRDVMATYKASIIMRRYVPNQI